MAAWGPVIKVALPYLTQIVTAAIPAFTSKPPPTDRPDEVQNKQIAELQTAVTRNAESVKGLATQLKDTIEVIDQGANRLEHELTRMRQLVVAAIAIAVVSLGVAVAAVLG
jgi:hypothetical protein